MGTKSLLWNEVCTNGAIEMTPIDLPVKESVLVVVEGDAACTFWMDQWGDQPEGDWAMLEQEVGEPDASFSERLEQTLDRAGRSRESTETIVLVTSGRVDAKGMNQHWDLSSTLAGHLFRAGGGRLVLTRGHGHANAADEALFDLADALFDEWSDSGIAIETRLGDEPASGRDSERPVSYVRELAGTAQPAALTG